MDWLAALPLFLGIYFAIGLTFALVFVAFGLGTFDDDARRAPARVRLLFIPASMALWPILGPIWISRLARSGKAEG